MEMPESWVRRRTIQMGGKIDDRWAQKKFLTGNSSCWNSYTGIAMIGKKLNRYPDLQAAFGQDAKALYITIGSHTAKPKDVMRNRYRICQMMIRQEK